jgi:FkbM family methyltransferase
MALSQAHRGNLIEWVTERVIHGHCRPGDTAVDVGANYGAHTFTMCQRVGPEGRAIACEANPEVAIGLVEWAAWRKNLTVVQKALADFQGEANFFVAKSTGVRRLSKRSFPSRLTPSTPRWPSARCQQCA